MSATQRLLISLRQPAPRRSVPLLSHPFLNRSRAAVRLLRRHYREGESSRRVYSYKDREEGGREKAQAPGRTGGRRELLHRASYGPGLILSQRTALASSSERGKD